MEKKIQHILFGLVVIVLLLPLVNDKTRIINTEGLKGYYTRSDDTVFSVAGWMNGRYQEKKARYLNDNISVRPDLIRLNAQVNYSLFHLNLTGWGVFGKENCLLDEQYINAWNGSDYIGYDSMYARMMKLRALQDTFAKMGKTIILVHAANKAYFYANCVPDNYPKPGKNPTNYGTCIRIGDSLGVNQLDLNLWFCRMKDTCIELLYAKQGIHWTWYGSMLGADSIAGYIGRLRHTSMRRIRVRDAWHTTMPKYPDNDIAAALNLILPVTTETFTYGTISCDSGRAITGPKALYIGDSFIWNWVNNDVLNCMHSDWQFWFYMQERYLGGPGWSGLSFKDYDWLAEVERTDCILLVYTANNLNRLGNGFIEQAYAHYFPNEHL